MEFNLNKANRFLVKLKAQLGQLASFPNYHSLWIDYRNYNLDQINKTVKSKQDTFETYKAVLTDYYLLKEAVFNKNAEIGVARILNKIELYSTLIKRASRIIENNDTTEIDDLVEPTDESSSRTVNITIFDKALIEREIKYFRKEINQLEDERDTLNSSSKVKLEFSPKTLEIIGLTE